MVVNEQKMAFLAIQADLAETERQHERQQRLKAKIDANMGTYGFKATDREKDWFTLTHASTETPSPCRYSPQHNFTKPDRSGFAGYQEENTMTIGGKTSSNNRDAWLGRQAYYSTEQLTLPIQHTTRFQQLSDRKLTGKLHLSRSPKDKSKSSTRKYQPTNRNLKNSQTISALLLK